MWSRNVKSRLTRKWRPARIVSRRGYAHTLDSYGHDRTLLVGDFNMNPFDYVMNMATGMNAMMTRKCVERGSRRLQKQDYPFFYNPMWAFFGDQSKGPAGTHFYRDASPITYFWNIFDQVLIRPALMDAFHNDVEILTFDGEHSLLTKRGRPSKARGSDHLPLLFRLEL